jgi:CheY-like chemotaxis protein
MTTAEASTAPVDVLIVDDDPLARRALRAVLERAGYHCEEASDGPQAMDQALRNPPRCVLLDLIMPGLDGFVVARRMRSDPRTRGAHLHCLTGRTDQEARTQALQAGFETYLVKPVSPRLLLEVVRREARGEDWVFGLQLAEARELLDWLENHGCTSLEMVTLEEGGCAVRCVPPPGTRLVQEEGGAVRLVPA